MADQRAVLVSYEEGVSAVEEIAARFAPADWTATACGAWTAEQLAAHLVGVARWYHQWLDRAEAGEDSRPFPGGELDERNEVDIAEMDIAGGPARIATYATLARSYAERLPAAWDLPYGYPRGSVTAGIHAGAVIAEWHLHAWDLASAVGADHRPSDPALVFDGVGTALGVARSFGPRAVAMRTIPPLVRSARRRKDPWQLLLERSGRT